MHSPWGTGRTAFYQRGKWRCCWEWKCKETSRNVGKAIVTKQWHATIKTAGSWKRPDVTATVIQFFFTVTHSLLWGKLHLYENEGKWRFILLFSKLNIMGHHHVHIAFIYNRTFSGTCLIGNWPLSPKVGGKEALWVGRMVPEPPLGLRVCWIDPTIPKRCLYKKEREEISIERNLRIKF